jgi:hypothetical protein
LQARHGARLEEANWQALEGARSFAGYLDRTKSTGLRRFTERMQPDSQPHTIEQRLREARRNYAEEIASWMPASWQPAVRWAALMPDLPILSYLLKGGAAWPWMAADSVLAPLAQAPAAARGEQLKEAGLGGLARDGEHSEIAQCWLEHWRLLWAAGSSAERRHIEGLVAGVAQNFQRSAHAGTGAGSAPERRDLAKHLTRCFRANSATPAVVFCHLGLVALDIERLRGGLLRRLLLEGGNPTGVA